jgi:hypothetical protein
VIELKTRCVAVPGCECLCGDEERDGGDEEDLTTMMVTKRT